MYSNTHLATFFFRYLELIPRSIFLDTCMRTHVCREGIYTQMYMQQHIPRGVFLQISGSAATAPLFAQIRWST